MLLQPEACECCSWSDSRVRNRRLRALGLQLILVQASTDDEIAISRAPISQRATARLVSGDVRSFTTGRKQIAQLAAAPFDCRDALQCREQAVAGGLMSYGADITDTFRHAGSYVGRILKGDEAG